MLEINKYLKKEIKKMSGKIITIGIDEKLFDEIEKNQKITSCMALNSTLYEEDDVRSWFRRNKVLDAKGLRKKFKKKKHTCMIMDIRHIENTLKTVIRDSIYVTSETIYIYGAKKTYDVEVLKKRYKRYKVKINYNEYKNSYIMKIDVKKAKNNKILDILYYISDTISNGVEILSNYLVN